MANNRLYLKCKQCGKVVMLGKHFGDALRICENLEHKLQEFFLDHNYCDYCHYDLELCEEFPCNMTDNPYDECGSDWRLGDFSNIAIDNVLVFNREKCLDIDFDSFPSDARIYLASDEMLGRMYCMSINARTWTHDGKTWDEFARIHCDEIERL